MRWHTPPRLAAVANGYEVRIYEDCVMVDGATTDLLTRLDDGRILMYDHTYANDQELMELDLIPSMYAGSINEEG